MRIAVIVSDATAQASAGLDMERSFRVFDCPPEIAEYINNRAGPFTTVTIAIEDETNALRPRGSDDE